MKASNVRQALNEVANPDRARLALRYFRTGPGEYGEGDVFQGATAAQLQAIVRRFRSLPLAQISPLLASPIHEQRTVGLLILVDQYARGDAASRKRVYDLYMERLDRVNNWDLVDCSAHKILGRHLFEGKRSTKVLDKLGKSKNLWRRRVAMVATHAWIREKEFEVPLRIAQMLLHDDHDLIHKAVGWMLREIGKRDLKVMEGFLLTRYQTMPRTMLRYAIEKLPEKRRKAYLAGMVKGR